MVRPLPHKIIACLIAIFLGQGAIGATGVTKVYLFTTALPPGVDAGASARRVESMADMRAMIRKDPRLELIDVPDREISRVEAGLPVRFRLEAFAGEPWSGQVAKVHPQSEQRDGHNVFIAEAPVRNTDRQLELRKRPPALPLIDRNERLPIKRRLLPQPALFAFFGLLRWRRHCCARPRKASDQPAASFEAQTDTRKQLCLRVFWR